MNISEQPLQVRCRAPAQVALCPRVGLHLRPHVSKAECASGKNSSQSMQTLQRKRCQTRTRPRKSACVYAARMSGAMLGEYDANQTPIYETVYLGNNQAALPVGVMKQTGTVANNNITTDLYYVYADHIHTPRVITRPIDSANFY
jgi:hypothetical protein